MKKAGYATSPTYPQRLLKVINDYNLQQYSLTALAKASNPAPAPANTNATTPAAVNTNYTTVVVGKENTNSQASQSLEQSVVETPAKETVTIKEDTQPVNATAPVTVVVADVKNKKTASYPAGIFSINHTKVIYAAEGTSLLSLANQYDLPLSRLIEFNELPEMDILDTDRLLFLEKKPKKGTTDFHTVAGGETLHEIAQLEGIRLESLLEYNQLSKTSSINAGSKLFLHAATGSTSTRKPK